MNQYGNNMKMVGNLSKLFGNYMESVENSYIPILKLYVNGWKCFQTFHIMGKMVPSPSELWPLTKCKPVSNTPLGNGQARVNPLTPSLLPTFSPLHQNRPQYLRIHPLSDITHSWRQMLHHDDNESLIVEVPLGRASQGRMHGPLNHNSHWPDVWIWYQRHRYNILALT